MAAYYDPLNILTQLSQLQRDLDRKHELGGGIPESTSATAEWTPSVDIKEETDRYVLLADLPGVSPEKIEINMENGILTLSGEKTTEAKTQREGYKRIERVYGSFHRRFSMPDTVDAEGIGARCTNGVLEISIPKKSVIQPKKIVVVNGS